MREILLHVLGREYCDPMRMLTTTQKSREALSTYTRRFALVADPPPDTLFMRATGIDLGVFGEDLPDGHLQMMDARHASATLEEALTTEAVTTVDDLVAAAGNPAWRPAIELALSSGSWSEDPDPRRAAILQASGFAHQLLLATRTAPQGAIIWEYTGGLCSYEY